MMHQPIEANTANSNEKSHNQGQQHNTRIKKRARSRATVVRFKVVIQFVSYPQLFASFATRCDGDRKTYSLYEPR
jgi:hypothetical protein